MGHNYVTMAEQHSFIFPIATIKQLVEQRTSYLGKMRGSEAEPHLLNRLSLTDGEDFLSNEYLEEAAAETYDWIKAFGRNVRNAIRIYPSGDLHIIKENHGAHLEVNSANVGLSYKQDITSGYYYSVRNSGQSNNDVSAYTVHINLPQNVKVAVGEAAEVHYSVIINYTTGINGAPIEDKVQEILNLTTDADVADSNVIFTVQLTTALGDMVVKSVESVEFKITKAIPEHFTLKKDDYILYQLANGGQKYGIVSADYDSNGIAPVIVEELGGDVRGSIVMKVELPDWQDKNMLFSVERNLKEALAFYIIWRWFETVYPQEAELFHSRWEEKAHQAQLGLNTESHVLQRKSDWLQ